MEQQTKTRKDLASLVWSLERSKDKIAEAQAKYDEECENVQIEASVLISQAEAAFIRYEESGKKDKSALAEADEKYILYRMTFDALPEDVKRGMGLKRLPTDNIDYLTQK
ncbi:MAG: hypothetical protein AABY10_00415 [Nanoarchaeota archaeon]